MANWFIRVDRKFDIISRLNINDIWELRQDWNFEELSQLMYEFHELKQEEFLDFVSKNKDKILSYLRVKTESLRIYEESDGIHIKYILLPQDIKKANIASVSRINTACKFLPIYDTYFTDAIRPQIDFMNIFSYNDDSHKEMPIRNVLISFNADLNQLWNKSILSHYEFVSVYDWQNHWIKLRRKVIELFKLNIEGLEKILKQQNQNQATLTSLDEIRRYICNTLICEKPFPYQERPFEEKPIVNEFTRKIKEGYFTSIRNYFDQFINIIEKNKENNLCNLAIINLKDSRSKLQDMQQCFNKVCGLTVYYFDIVELEQQEVLWLDRLIILNEYYINNTPKKGEFSHYTVTRWKKEEMQKFIDQITEGINEAEESGEFAFIKPYKILSENNLNKVPIGVKNLNTSDENVFTSLVESLIPFAEIDINYIVLINIDDQLQASSSGIQINTYLFKEINKCMEKSEILDMNIMTTPLPCEITNEHLSCFQEHIELINNTQSIDFEDIYTFLLSLWEYSQYLNHLNVSENEEKTYLTNKIKQNAMKIEKDFSSLKDKIPFCFIDRLIALKDDVIENQKTFKDKDLNDWLNEIILYINESL